MARDTAQLHEDQYIVPSCGCDERVKNSQKCSYIKGAYVFSLFSSTAYVSSRLLLKVLRKKYAECHGEDSGSGECPLAILTDVPRLVRGLKCMSKCMLKRAVKLLERLMALALEHKVVSTVVILGSISTLSYRFYMRRRRESVRRAKNAISFDYDVIVIGAGVTGCPLALKLANQGKRVALVDKHWQKHERIVGELLQPKGIEVLERCGMSTAIHSEELSAIPHFGYCVLRQTKHTDTIDECVLPYAPYLPANLDHHLGFVSSALATNCKGDILSNVKSSMRDLCDAKMHYARTELSDLLLKKFCSSDLPLEYRVRSMGLNNGSLIELLRRQCKLHPSITTIDGYVSDLLTSPMLLVENTFSQCKPKLPTCIGIHYLSCADGETNDEGKNNTIVTAPLTILCDGGETMKLKKLYNSNAVCAKDSTWLGLLIRHAELHTPLPNPGYAHIFMIDPKPAIMYQIDRESTRLLLCSDEEVGNYEEYVEKTILPQLPAEIRSAIMKCGAHKIKNISVKLSYCSSVTVPERDGIISIGDSNNCRSPLTGSGMTVNLLDAMNIAEFIKACDITCPDANQAIYRQLVRARCSYATTLNALANALNVLLTKGDDIDDMLRDAIFNYFKNGGFRAVGPINMLGGVTQNPMVLVMHYANVILNLNIAAIYSSSVVDLPRNVLRANIATFRAIKLMGRYISIELNTYMSAYF